MHWSFVWPWAAATTSTLLGVAVSHYFALKREEDARRRDYEVRALRELRELLIVASSELDILLSSLRGEMIDQAAVLMAT